MDISSVSNASFSRSVTPSKNSSDRQSSEQTQELVEAKANERREHERAVQEKLQHSRDENQRRLDGRLISFGYEQQDDTNNQTNQASYNRSRVNEAYSAVSNESSNSHHQNRERSQSHNVDAIDIVV